MLKTRKIRVEKVQPRTIIKNPSYKPSHLKILEVFKTSKNRRLNFDEINKKLDYNSRSRIYEALRYLHATGDIGIEKVTGHWMGKGRFRYRYYLMEAFE